MDAEGVHLEREIGGWSSRWSVLQRVDAYGRAISLRFDGTHLLVPRNAFANAAQEAAFLSFVRARLAERQLAGN